MPVVRIDNKGMTIQDRQKHFAKRLSIVLVLVGIAAVATYIHVTPEAGIMVGLIAPTLASLLNLWSE